jgi:hypothetical protein
MYMQPGTPQRAEHVEQSLNGLRTALNRCWTFTHEDRADTVVNGVKDGVCQHRYTGKRVITFTIDDKVEE